MSQDVDHDQTSVLEIAWRHYAEFDANATNTQKLHLSLRGWVIVLGLVATLLAVLIDFLGNYNLNPFLDRALRIGLILVPIIGSTVLAFANKFQQGERWLALRTGAEEILREIYLYRTILQRQEDRHKWLSDRITAIQRQVFELVGGDLVLKPYTGNVPPHYSPHDGNSDPGFSNLLAEDYLHYRLNDQLNWHTNKVAAYQSTRIRWQAAIFFLGGLGTFLAALANMPGFSSLSVWVALTTALAAAATAWIELRQLDSIISNYSQLILELNIIQDHWRSLPHERRTGDEFFKLVIATEKVLWSQHSKFTSEMRKAVAELHGEAGDTLDKVAKMPAPLDLDEAIIKQAKMAAASTGTPASLPTAGEEIVAQVADEAVEDQQGETSPTGRPHAFVVMPFGRKQGPDGRWIDFDSIYYQLIKPALERAGFESFRADQETISGDILTDMFQELLLADLVIADLSIDNANAFYELGVRHALRKRGVVHIQSGRAYLPFDIFNVRTIPYQCGLNGKPDPAHLEKDIQTIAKVALDTWASDQDRIHSPIFNLLDGLTEPDRKALRTPLAVGYWREYKEWQERVNIARRQNHIGDVLLLTEEVRNPLIREEAIAEAGQALRDLGHHALALQQYRHGLEINPRNREFRREEAFALGRLKRCDEAIVKLERLIQDNPDDSEAIAFLGRLYKDIWVDEWVNIEENQTRLKAAYDAAHLLKRSIEHYLAAYGMNQGHFYSGINALTLALILDHLARQVGEPADLDPDVEAIRQQLPSLTGAVQFSIEQATNRDGQDFWTFASLGDIAVNTAQDPRMVTRAYRKALALSGKSMYAIQSILDQLHLLDSLAFRPEFVKAGIAVLQDAFGKSYEIEQVETGQPADEPAQVFLFSGHMIDRSGRPEPRFPPSMEEEARIKIEHALDKLKATPSDMVITAGAACGGDILFIEACLKRQMKVEVYLPFNEAKFIEESVSFAGDAWVERFYQIRQDPNVTFHLQPDRLGPVPKGEDPYARNNRWALYSTLCYSIERVRLIVLWDGKGGDGPGGTGHMVKEVRQLGGIVEHLNTTRFDYWKAKGKVGKALDKLIQGD